MTQKKVRPTEGGIHHRLSVLLNWVFLFVCILGSVSNALATCTSTNTTNMLSVTQPNISAGVDIPNGTIIYTAKLNTSTSVPCTNGTEYQYYTYMTSAPLPLSAWTGSPYGGYVYETGIPGIGVAFTVFGDANSNAVKVGTPYLYGTPGLWYTSNGSYAWGDVSVFFIKIGPLSAGSYSLNSAMLPDVDGRMIMKNGGYATIFKYRLSGTLTISAKTCTTPDLIVPMGTYPVNDTFRGVGSTTPWIETRFALRDCPVFYGYYNKSNQITSSLSSGATTPTVTTPVSINNSLGVRLTPNTSVVGAVANGVMAIDTSASTSAAGIGIQIGWGSSSGAPVPFNFSVEKLLTLAKDGTATIPIPLVARYIQTSSQVRPGRADGTATFTINYY